MLRKTAALLCLLVCFLMPLGMAEAKVAVLCYHEVDRENDVFSVTASRFEGQLEWMKNNGYHFVSLDEYIAYTKGEISLPEKSVMITFDDGYRSFYTKVYPLLRKYRVPGMLAIVSSWTNGEEHPSDVGAVASWQELREMEQSGLVTVVSHSHALHKQKAVNPQGSRNGAAGSHLYVNDAYETDEAYTSRIANDMAEAQRLFTENLGHRARAMVWPYGIYTKQSVMLALDSGMEATFLLDGGVNGQGDDARLYARRIIMERDSDIGRLLTVDHDEWNSKNLRMAQVDLDNIYDEDPAQYERNVRSLVDSLLSNNINVAAVQAFADGDGDGNVDRVYFANSVIPVEADIFSDVVTRIQQQGITTLAWIPVLNYQSLIRADGSNAVQSAGEKGWYNRLSPFDREALSRVNRLFYDLAANTQVEGILLQDDLYLNQDEDVSEPARQDFLSRYGKELSEADKGEKILWKVNALDEAAEGAVNAFRSVRPFGIIMRDIYAGAVLYPGAEEWLGQSYEDYLKRYDYAVVMAYPFMDKEEKPYEYLKKIADIVKAKGGSDKTIIKVQAYDWHGKEWLSDDVMKRQMSTLKKEGIKNMGYYPLGYFYWNN